MMAKLLSRKICFGLDISVGLSKKSTDNKQKTDLAIITIGDSSIKLPCDENGLFE